MTDDVLSGILPVNKPSGWTSHDVVARLRRVAGQRAVGHAGTLDPLATGVLLLVMGRATRLSSYLMESEKVYRAQIVLGATTVTDDAEAPPLDQADISALTLPAISAAVTAHTGDLLQVPPRYAAIKRGGEKLYALARKGIAVEVPPRPVTISRIDIDAWEPPILSATVTCSPGTYIRSLARDIGASLGVGGYLHALCRLRSGSFSLDDCVLLDHLQTRADVSAALYPPDRAVLTLPALYLSAPQVGLIATGRPVRVGPGLAGPVRLYGPDDTFVALGEAVDGGVRPKLVFTSGRTDAHR